MKQVTVYHAHGRWFIYASNGVKEIPYAIVSEWQRSGELEIKEVEQYD